MSPSQASSDDFPRLVGAENFDVWKARVCTALDGKHLLGYVKQLDYDSVSEDESETNANEMSDINDEPAARTS
ncbi:Neutral zinc metallopeptidase [Phytophthora megakarya]|uniref:Neutral zinc metallopeptidase n=1 Tax=Phytophthora megakarya TaxID=4795 RepID=A0A225WF77_9STRA|nr:Neutral zinc metallopeptidase [Phytophthora megakarya]